MKIQDYYKAKDLVNDHETITKFCQRLESSNTVSININKLNKSTSDKIKKFFNQLSKDIEKEIEKI